MEQDKFFEFPHEGDSNFQETSNFEIPSESDNMNKQNMEQFHRAVPSEANQFNDSKTEFDAVVKASKEMDERLATHLEKNEGLIRRFFPTKMQKLVAQKERLMVGSALDFRLNLLKLGNEFRLEAMRDRYDTYLKAYKGENRLQLTKFMIAKINELYKVVKTDEIAGIHEIEQMYSNALTISQPTLRAKYLNRVSEREDRYLNSIAKLIAHFENILDEHLSR